MNLQHPPPGRYPPRPHPLALLLLFAIAFVLTPMAALATGTPAGTLISNTAQASYSVGASSLSKSSNTSTFAVAELINVNVVSQDGGNVGVVPGTDDQYLTFTVTNTGNGDESFTLSADSAIAGDDFDPTLVGIFADTNGDGQYTPGVDLAVPGGVVDLAADAGVTLFVVNNIPSTLPDGVTPIADGQTGTTSVSITSNTGSGALGTLIPNGGDGGTIDAIIGSSGGLPATTDATYTATSISLDVAKTAVIVDPYGGSTPIPGATVTYSLVVTVSGSGTAVGLTITDPIPANTTYKPGSLTLDGVGLSDGAGNDDGEATGSPVNLITVRLGDMTAGSKTITFAVVID